MLAERLQRLVVETGPISVARYMTLALTHPAGGYYCGRDPFGRSGDFVTAPEISQVFGELIGLVLAQSWLEMGRPSRIGLVELGPGRGTLLTDAMRAARVVPGFLAAAELHLVETSPVLRARQATALAAASVSWHGELATVPPDLPLLLVANEFLDALPIRQFVRHRGRWHERLIAVDDVGGFRFVLAGRATPFPHNPNDGWDDLADGTVLELGPARDALAQQIAARIVAQGGLALIVDYGRAATAMLGDTLQAVREHRVVDPLLSPGEADLSADVDFAALRSSARAAGAVAWGPLTQAKYLDRLGIWRRLARLTERATPEQREMLEQGCARLVGPDAMGERFKVLAITASDAPIPAGFLDGEQRA